MSKGNTNRKGGAGKAQSTRHNKSTKGVTGVRSAATGRFFAKNYAKAISYIVKSEETETGLMISSSNKLAS
jgi:hypothetical protein